MKKHFYASGIIAIILSMLSSLSASAQYYEIANRIPSLIQPALSGSGQYKGFIEAGYSKTLGNYDADFLYRSDLESWLEKGIISKLDLAFSRDTENKIYVQHRIEENGADFYKWLRNGATVYLCGDKDEMAKGVHQSLVNVLVQHGDFTQAQAEDYLTELIKNQRYQRDVY